jgi:hypothetical protein
VNELKQSACKGAVAELLPWYVNETLDEQERAFVRSHVESCEHCRQDVEFLARLGQAVRTESPSPLVPAPRSDELLAALDRSERRISMRRRWPGLAAAALILLAVAGAILIAPWEPSVDSPTRYETATSSSADDVINFVVELEFGDGIGDLARSELFDDIDVMSPIRTGEHSYRVTLAPGSLSLSDLEVYIESIRSRPEIANAEVVAVQLPVE